MNESEVMKQIDYITYEVRFDDIGSQTAYHFYPDDVWDEYTYTYSEALEAYPLDEYEWVKIEILEIE
jgi:hypothetical protein